jgi:RIO kinase 1
MLMGSEWKTRSPSLADCESDGVNLALFRPSPRLKDAEIPSSQLAELYAELLVAMRWMYHRCKIVHADLSEYNIL